MKPEFTPLTINAEQWRRDIKTFAEATNQALEAIVSQLSNRCTNDFSPAEVSHFKMNPPREPIAGGLQMPSETTTAGIDKHGDNRLAELKFQLAQRISQST